MGTNKLIINVYAQSSVFSQITKENALQAIYEHFKHDLYSDVYNTNERIVKRLLLANVEIELTLISTGTKLYTCYASISTLVHITTNITLPHVVNLCKINLEVI